MTTTQLLQCPACGGPLARTATACPACGAPNTWLHPEIERFKAAMQSLKLPAATYYQWKSAVLTATSQHILEPEPLQIDFGTEPPTVTTESRKYWRPVLAFFGLASEPPTSTSVTSRTGIVRTGPVVLFVVVAIFVGYQKIGKSLIADFSAISGAEHIIQRAMADPDSFKKKSAEVVWRGRTGSGRPAFAVKVEYSGRNAFGGTVHGCNTVIYYKHGDQINWLPADANLPCESGDILKRGDREVIDRLTWWIQEQ